MFTSSTELTCRLPPKFTCKLPTFTLIEPREPSHVEHLQGTCRCRGLPNSRHAENLPGTCRKTGIIFRAHAEKLAECFVVLMPSIAISEYLEFSKSQLLLEPTAALSAVSIASNTTDALAHPVQFSQHSAPSASPSLQFSHSEGKQICPFACFRAAASTNSLRQPRMYGERTPKRLDRRRLEVSTSIFTEQSTPRSGRTSARVCNYCKCAHIRQGCAASLSASGRSEHQKRIFRPAKCPAEEKEAYLLPWLRRPPAT